MLQNNSAESPIEVGFVVMLMVISMSFLLMVTGTMTDKFMAVMEAIRLDMPLSAWGESMWALLPVTYSAWVYIVPGFFVLVIVIWAIKTQIKKHEYSTQDTQFMSDEY